MEPCKAGHHKDRDLIKEIYLHAGYEPILRVLKLDPARYSEVRAGLIANLGSAAPGDSQLSRDLRSMRELDLIEAQGDAKQRVWKLTASGEQAVAFLDAAGRSQIHAPEVAGPAASDKGSNEPRRKIVVDRRDTPEIDTSKAHPARRYNYFLGGKDNFAADRESGDAIEKGFPTIRLAARENRAFLQRAVQFLTREAGIRQFLDIGTGLPTANNTHEVAQAIAPQSRVVYVDNDPIVLTHARALLSSNENGKTAYIDADLRKPHAILADTALRETLDLSRPVGLILVAVLHFIPGEDAALPIVRDLLSALPSGSYLVATHATHDFVSPEYDADFMELHRAGKVDIWPRSYSEFARIFTGLDVVAPGIVQVNQWRSDPLADPEPPENISLWGAVARKL